MVWVRHNCEEMCSTYPDLDVDQVPFIFKFSKDSTKDLVKVLMVILEFGIQNAVTKAQCYKKQSF